MIKIAPVSSTYEPNSPTRYKQSRVSCSDTKPPAPSVLPLMVGVEKRLTLYIKVAEIDIENNSSVFMRKIAGFLEVNNRIEVAMSPSGRK